MSAATRTFESVRDVILSCHQGTSGTTPEEKVAFYNTWAENYNQDVAILDYRAPRLAACSLSRHFTGDRAVALVLDVACGTGLVASQLKKHGFRHFVGIDGSKAMREAAQKTELYQDLRHCMLGEEELPCQWGSFDAVLIVGALSVGHVPVRVVRELCKAAKPGGYICMTTRMNQDNMEYKVALDHELKLMEEAGLCSCVDVTEVEDWERAVSDQEEGYISGSVYLYKALAQ